MYHQKKKKNKNQLIKNYRINYVTIMSYLFMKFV